MRWEGATWREGIVSMVRYGVSQWRKNNRLTLKFEVFNTEERDYVHQCMDATPHVPYFTTRIM